MTQRHRRQCGIGTNGRKWFKHCGIPVSILAASRRRRQFFGGKRRRRSGGGTLGAGTAYNLLGWLLNVRACITSESCGCRSAAVTSLATLTPTKVASHSNGHRRHPGDRLHEIQALRSQNGRGVGTVLRRWSREQLSNLRFCRQFPIAEESDFTLLDSTWLTAQTENTLLDMSGLCWFDVAPPLLCVDSPLRIVNTPSSHCLWWWCILVPPTRPIARIKTGGQWHPRPLSLYIGPILKFSIFFIAKNIWLGLQQRVCITVTDSAETFSCVISF